MKLIQTLHRDGEQLNQHLERKVPENYKESFIWSKEASQDSVTFFVKVC